MNYDPAIARLNEAAMRLAAKGLLQAGDTLSQRLAPTGHILLLTAPASAPRMEIAPLSDSPASHAGAMARHLELYQARADVGCVLQNRQPWASALHTLGRGMPGIFDEQIRHLGRSVERLDSAAQLSSGANAWFTADHVLCLGTIPERTVFNAELLEKCAKAYVLATSAGMPVGRIPWLVRWIANGRLMKDERRAAAQYAQGHTPVLSGAY